MLDILGFQCIQSDNFIYIYCKRNVKIITSVFLDDITLMSKDESTKISIVQELQQHFKLHNLKPTSFLLSVQVKQDLEAHTISLS